MSGSHKTLPGLVLLLLIGASVGTAYGGPPTCTFGFQSPFDPVVTRGCSFQMPAYDQTNPNFAAYLSPTTVVNDVSANASTAAITAFEINSNIITFTANNNFSSGETVAITGLSSTIGKNDLNWNTFTVLGNGLSSSGPSLVFEALFDHANVALTSDSGLASAGPTPVPNMVVCNPNSPSVCGNPFDSSWLPAGPIPGDAYSFNTWWFSATCCPTAESMALMAAIAAKSSSTTFNGWTASFYAGQAPGATTGLTNQSGPIFPFVPDTRTNMQVADIQRVIDMALAQGTDPSAGGNVNYITTGNVLNDFTPVATAAFGATSAISNGTFISDIEAGNVIVIAVHYYRAQITTTGSGASTITFTWIPGGHCLAVPGFISSSFRDPLGVTTVNQAIEVINPEYGAEQWINILNLTNGTFTQGGQSVTVTLPNGWTSVGVWPDPPGQTTPPVNSVWDITNGEEITFIDTYLTLNVP
jgi:hypothetical protein